MTFVPILYYLTIPFWLIPGFKKKIQYWVGLFIYIVFGPAMRTIVIIYTILHMADFSWGKTRMVVLEDSPEKANKDKLPLASKEEENAVKPADSNAPRDIGEDEKRLGL